MGISPNPTPVVTIEGGPGACDGDDVTLTASTGASAGTPCTYTLQMDDTFGDGWNGAELTLRKRQRYRAYLQQWKPGH